MLLFHPGLFPEMQACAQVQRGKCWNFTHCMRKFWVWSCTSMQKFAEEEGEGGKREWGWTWSLWIFGIVSKTVLNISKGKAHRGLWANLRSLLISVSFYFWGVVNNSPQITYFTWHNHLINGMMAFCLKDAHYINCLPLLPMHFKLLPLEKWREPVNDVIVARRWESFTYKLWHEWTKWHYWAI